MSLPVGKLVVYPPDKTGLVTKFGLSRDWRPAAQKWRLKGCEFIEPLRCIAPAATMNLKDFDWEGIWTKGGNEKWRACYISGNPAVKAAEYTDGSVHSNTDEDRYGTLASASTYMPRFGLHIARWAPPPGQEILVYVTVTCDCQVLQETNPPTGTRTWQDGRLCFFFPAASQEHRNVFIHAVAPAPTGYYNVYSVGQIIGTLESNGVADQGPSRETYWVEYEEIVPFNEAWEDETDSAAGDWVGCEFLLRSSRDPGTIQRVHTDIVRAKASQMLLLAQGAICKLAWWPLTYGEMDNTKYPPEPIYPEADAVTPLPLPHEVVGNDVEEDAWEEDVTWDPYYREAPNWTVTVLDHRHDDETPPNDIDVARRPIVTFTFASPGQTERPLLWNVGEDHLPTIGDANTAEPYDTDATDVLERLTWKWAKDWKSHEGSAEYIPCDIDDYDDLHAINSVVTLHAGWDTHTQIATAYIPLEGTHVEASGAQVGPGLKRRTYDLQGFWQARLPQKDVLDMRQAGGMTVGDWAALVGARLGIPADSIDVDEAVASRVIPGSPLPSEPHLEARDGSSWQTHIQEVERAATIRVKFDTDGTGNMAVDGGAPEYEHGVSTISATIDEASLTALPEQMQRVGYNGDPRNVLKATYGQETFRRVYYRAETLAQRKVSAGDDWPLVVEDDTAATPAEIVARFLKENYTVEAIWRITIPMDTALRPDMFVQAAGTCKVLLANAVFRIIEHEIEVTAGDQPDAVSHLSLEFIEVPEEPEEPE